MEKQNYNNHSQKGPVLHYVAYFLIACLLGASAIKFYKSYTYNYHNVWIPAFFLTISVVLLLITFYTRHFSLKAQDRAIRAEENLRYFAITGNLLDPKLALSQIIALRFAPNNEFVDLAHRAVKENMSAKDIKKAIRDWKGDYYRV